MFHVVSFKLSCEGNHPNSWEELGLWLELGLWRVGIGVVVGIRVGKSQGWIYGWKELVLGLELGRGGSQREHDIFGSLHYGN